MPVTAWSPMVCEQVVCPALLLSSANEWTPVHGAMKVTLGGLTLSWPSVYRLFVCLYYPPCWHCFCLYECVIGYLKSRSIIGEYEYVHMWTLFFLLPYLYMYLCLTLSLLFSQENNLTELWRTIRTKVGRAWKSDRVTSSAGTVTK